MSIYINCIFFFNFFNNLYLKSNTVIDIYDSSTLAAPVNGDIEVENDSPITFAADLNGDTVADIYDLSILHAVLNGEIEI